jgi:hypothetical protein
MGFTWQGDTKAQQQQNWSVVEPIQCAGAGNTGEITIAIA